MAPLYGTCSGLTPMRLLNISAISCVGEARPDEPNEYLAGSAFSSAMNSFRLFAGTLGATASTKPMDMMSQTGAKSRIPA